MKPVRILVADDHALVRRGIRTLLENQPGWKVCAEASTGREAIEQAEQTKPDVVVLDVSMPELNGLDATPAGRPNCNPQPGTRQRRMVVQEGYDGCRAEGLSRTTA